MAFTTYLLLMSGGDVNGQAVLAEMHGVELRWKANKARFAAHPPE